jgi:hypothetical protein
MAKSGGLGIYSDFLLADVNSFAGGSERTIAGPVTDRIANLVRLTTGNMQQVAAGEKTNAGRELVQFAKMNTPGASIWWLRLMAERHLFDRLQIMADPDAYRSMRRRIDQRRRDFGQNYWWEPGKLAPGR